MWFLTASQRISPEMTVNCFKMCVTNAMDETDDTLSNGTEEDGNVRNECEEDGDTDCEDGDSDTDW